jgi:hypothetical protein
LTQLQFLPGEIAISRDCHLFLIPLALVVESFNFYLNVRTAEAEAETPDD